MDSSNTSSNSNNLTNQTEATAADTELTNMMLAAMMPSQNESSPTRSGGAGVSSARSSFSPVSADELQLRERPLPSDFEPGPFTVIVGKSRSAKSHQGTLWLQTLAKANKHQYDISTKRSIKTAVITKILDEVKSRGCFAKRKGNQWWEVSDDAAREKIGYALRENLPEQYNSTSKAKGAIRLKQRWQDQGLLDPVPLTERAALSSLPPNEHPLTMDPRSLMMEEQRVSIPVGRPLALEELVQDEEMLKHIKSLQSMHTSDTDTLRPRTQSETEMLQVAPEPLVLQQEQQQPLHLPPSRESSPPENDSGFSSS